MAKSLSKVVKKVSKKRGGKLNALHENSRDSQRLRRAGAREEKIAKFMQAAKSSNQVYVNRVEWFQEAINEREESEKDLSDEDLYNMTTEYVHRLDEHQTELKAQRRPGRPMSSDEERVRAVQDAEEKEFKSGFWVPDVREKDWRQKLESWNGQWAGLNTLKFVRIMNDGSVKDSSFPPKGLS